MKYDNILTLTKSQFISELKRQGSRINHNPIQWTIAWLRSHNLPYKKIDSQNWIAAGVDKYHNSPSCHAADIKVCLDWLDKRNEVRKK